MAEKKPAKGKAPAKAPVKKRAPNVTGGKDKMPATKWMSPEVEAELNKRFGAKTAVEPEKQTILPGPEWELHPAEEKSTRVFSTSTEQDRVYSYTPGELGRKFALFNTAPTAPKPREKASINEGITPKTPVTVTPHLWAPPPALGEQRLQKTVSGPRLKEGDLELSSRNLLRVREENRQTFRKMVDKQRVADAVQTGHGYEVYHDNSVGIVPFKGGVHVPEETRLFSHNENQIKSDDFVPVAERQGLGHMVDGQHALAYNKVTTHYRRTNNNGVPGIAKVGEEVHPGTFYQHPETKQMHQTFNVPVVEPDTRDAVQKHGTALYDLYGPKSNKKDPYPMGPSTQQKINWAQSSLSKVINSVRNGDTKGTMDKLKSDPDSIHDLFHEHFRVVPQKLAAYRKLVKEGTISPVNIPKEVDFSRGLAGKTKAFSKVTGSFVPTSEMAAKERKVSAEEQERKKNEEENF
jgi:hypothetical protein